MTAKRRTIWMSDDQWDDLRDRAQHVNESPSRYLAALVEAAPRAYIPSHDDLVGYARRSGVAGVPEIDAAIERGEKGTPPTPFLKPAIDRAMREFRPAPKPGKR